MEVIHDLISPTEDERSTLKQKQWFRDEYCSDDEKHFYVIHHKDDQVNQLSLLGGFF